MNTQKINNTTVRFTKVVEEDVNYDELLQRKQGLIESRDKIVSQLEEKIAEIDATLSEFVKLDATGSQLAEVKVEQLAEVVEQPVE